MLPSLIFGLFVIALASVMLVLHTQAHRAANDGSAERGVVFARRRYRRRLQVCILLAVIGAAIIGGDLVHRPLLAVGYWLCVLGLVCWIAFLAVVDLMGS